MISPQMLDKLHSVIDLEGLMLDGNFLSLTTASPHCNQQQTNFVFSDKWKKFDAADAAAKSTAYQFQREWYLKLYGFPDRVELTNFLRSKNVIFDAGCGLGYKAAWFAELAPQALVIGMDYSVYARQAAVTYADIGNLVFIQGDIAATGFKSASVDYTNCDQVIMHTEDPFTTFAELARITSCIGELACYFYAKKALPRELLDDYFRNRCKEMTNEELWEMSDQLTELGRRLSELSVSFDCPAIPALGVKGGIQDIQRFIYWNFLKCFWNPQLGRETSIATNFDWYSPSNARRFSRTEITELLRCNGMREAFFHEEEACYSGRFVHA
jgi:ubiquinone/menaquinone biosynthesis C-methylase UbiE